MIEAGFFPVLAVMAGFAFLAITAVMRIIQRMTGITGFRGVLVPVIRMTALTAGFSVFAFQRELGFVVIESDFLPAVFIVTTVAFFAQLAVMRVVVTVAVIAL